MKKTLGLILSATLVLSMSVTAFAAGTTETTSSEYGVSITISNVINVTKEAESGHEIYHCEAPVTVTLVNSSATFGIIPEDESGYDDENDENPLSAYYDNSGVKLQPVYDGDEYADYDEYAAGSYWVVTRPGGYWLSGANVYLAVSGTSESETAPDSAPAEKTVSPTASTVYINDAAKAFEAYTIDGNNYFKLRDLALVLSGTDKQFEVGYDDATKAITLTSGKAYTPVGGEMTQGDGNTKAAVPTASKIYLDGTELSLTVYTVGGNNFFKLRDLLQAIDVYVGYDDATKNITVDTSKGYVAE